MFWNQNTELFVDSFSEFCASLELSNLLGSNCDLLLGCGVDTLTSGLLVNGECTETYESYFVTCYESVLYGCNGSVKSLL